MRLLVTGGRDYHDRKRVYRELDAIGPSSVIHGKAPGLDTLADDWAKERGVPVHGFAARWTDLVTPPVLIRYRRDGVAYNARAGGIRNQKMLDEGKPDYALVFPGGNGTADCLERIVTARIPHKVLS